MHMERKKGREKAFCQTTSIFAGGSNKEKEKRRKKKS